MAEVSAQDNQKSRRRRWPLLLLFAIALLLVAIGAVTYVRGLTSASQASAEAMPPDTLFYASIDAINLLDPRNLNTLNKGFGDLLNSNGIAVDSQDSFTTATTDSFAQYNISFDDIRPWIGRSIGMGVGTFRMTERGPMATSYLIITEIRDEAAADDFTKKFATVNDTADAEYRGVSYLVETTVSRNRLYLGRSGSLMIWASDVTAFERAVDAQKGESLASLDAYNNVLAKLPEQRMVTFMALNLGIETLISELANNNESMFALAGRLIESQQIARTLEDIGVDAYEAIAGSIGVANSGIEIDLASIYDSAKLSPEQISASRAIETVTGELPGQLPANTMFYFGGSGLGRSWERIKSMLAGDVSEEDFEDSMTLAEQTLGFGVENELVPQLTGDLGIAVYRDDESALVQLLGANIGVVMMQGVADSAETTALTNKFSDALTEQGFLINSENGASSIELFGTSVASYGVNNDSLIISTSRENVELLPNSAASLAANPLFATLRSILPDDMTITLFADTQVILSTVEASVSEGQSGQLIVDAIPMIGMGVRADEDGTSARIILGIQD